MEIEKKILEGSERYSSQFYSYFLIDAENWLLFLITSFQILFPTQSKIVQLIRFPVIIIFLELTWRASMGWNYASLNIDFPWYTKKFNEDIIKFQFVWFSRLSTHSTPFIWCKLSLDFKFYSMHVSVTTSCKVSRKKLSTFLKFDTKTVFFCSLRVIPREIRADSCNVGYIDVPDFAQSNFFG